MTALPLVPAVAQNENPWSGEVPPGAIAVDSRGEGPVYSVLQPLGPRRRR
jgi:hypothetical protein